MIVAIQGCSHGSLSQIYASVAKYESIHNKTVDLLLLCGDFQALRNRHDFASLAVPQKYQQLGTFHEYYSGKRRAPLLTLVIGGNHEASNYMWELYHGGWLAENIYYLGAAGCVNVGGLRIAGASGIFKDHDYHKGHFETVPYDHSTLRSAYHIRAYDVNKLMLLPEQDNTLFMSHDWPTTIPRFGNTQNLLRRKPFFRQEVETDTLGSPPLLQLMKKVQPEYWFSAHLHVKFAAIFKHGEPGQQTRGANGHSAAQLPPVSAAAAGNPDEIAIDSDDDFDSDPPAAPVQPPMDSAGNPDEINIDSDDDEPVSPAAIPIAPAPAPANANPDEINMDGDDDDDVEMGQSAPIRAEEALQIDESVDLVEEARKADPAAAAGVIGSTESPAPAPIPLDQAVAPSSQAGPSRTGQKQTRFLALDKCGPGKDFIQFLDIPAPSDANRDPSNPLAFTYDTRWLAITRALHPYLSLDIRAKPMPLPDHLETLVQKEMDRIEAEGVLVPITHQASGGEPNGQSEEGKLERLKGDVPVERVQRFWPTAPPEGQPGGSPSAWYTNPQTVAFCGMLEIENMINPAPKQ